MGVEKLYNGKLHNGKLHNSCSPLDGTITLKSHETFGRHTSGDSGPAEGSTSLQELCLKNVFAY